MLFYYLNRYIKIQHGKPADNISLCMSCSNVESIRKLLCQECKSPANFGLWTLAY